MIKLLFILDIVSFLLLFLISIFSWGDRITMMDEKDLSKLYLFSNFLVFIIMISNSILFVYGIYKLIMDILKIVA